MYLDMQLDRMTGGDYVREPLLINKYAALLDLLVGECGRHVPAGAAER